MESKFLPLKKRSKAQFVNPLSQAAARQRSRSVAYHTQRRAQMMAISRPVSGYTAVVAPSTRSGEVKTFDCSVTAPAANLPLSTAVGSGEPTAAFAGITELNDIRQGAAFYNRIGAKVVMRSVELTGEVFGTLAGLAAKGPCRFMIPLVAQLRALAGYC